jgi:hypothetical protein
MANYDRFQMFDWETIDKDEDDLPIVPPVTPRPDDLLTRTAQDIATFFDEEAMTRRVHDIVTFERRRLIEERRLKVLADAQAAAAAAALPPIPRTGTVKIPVEPKWSTLPFLDVNDFSSVYPWVRVFETLTCKATITPETRLEYFNQFPNSVPGTVQDVGVMFTRSTVDQTNYQACRNLFLTTYGPKEPAVMLLAEAALKAHTLTSTSAWMLQGQIMTMEPSSRSRYPYIQQRSEQSFIRSIKLTSQKRIFMT